MKARKVPKSYRNLTGNVTSIKSGQAIAFESGLESDFYALLDMDIYVTSFQDQPVKIEYIDAAGTKRHYTPDTLVVHRTDIDGGPQETWLCEVKYRNDLFEDWKKLKPKFKAARAFAKKRGWVFKVVTEVEIRTPALWNAKFLKVFKKYPFNDEMESRVQYEVQVQKLATVRKILEGISNEKWEQAKYTPYLWKRIGDRSIAADLDVKLSMNSPVWFSME